MSIPLDALRHRFELALPFDEFRVWAQRVRPVLNADGVPDACLDVLEYVCTEMLNNVLDHSGATRARVAFETSDAAVVMWIDDDGRGIFETLRQSLGLDSEADAALLLHKGKVTSDPARHTGEGLFFSSRVCDWFWVHSGRLALEMVGGRGPWSYATPNDAVHGTRLGLRLSRLQPTPLRDVFDRYCPQPELRFTRTDVSVVLMQQADGALVSRSQGKRLVEGLDAFSAVRFDFAGVDRIQQGFADEVFRVWARSRPAITVTVANAGDDVLRMLRHVGFDPDAQPAV